MEFKGRSSGSNVYSPGQRFREMLNNGTLSFNSTSRRELSDHSDDDNQDDEPDGDDVASHNSDGQVSGR